MSRTNAFRNVTQKLAGVVTLKDSSVEELRTILETEQNRLVTAEEAKEVGESLITTFRMLAGKREILGVTKQEANGEQ